MKKTQLLPVYLLLSAALTISSANQPTRYVLIDKLDFSAPNFPANHFDDNIFSDPQFNQYLLRDVNYFGQKSLPAMEITQENMGAHVNFLQTVNDSPYGWRIYNVNGQQEPQTPILKKPIVFPSRGFPISPEHFDLVKGTTEEIRTEVPVNEDEISFGPSASYVATAPKKINDKQADITFPSHYRNKEQENGHFYKTVDKMEPEEMDEVTAHKIKAIENVPDTTTSKTEHVSITTLPPVPTLSPWLDGFGK